MRHRLQIFALPILMFGSFQYLNAANISGILQPGEKLKFYAQSNINARQIMISHTDIPAIFEFNPTADQITICAENTGDAPNSVSISNDQITISLKAALESDLLGTIQFYIEIPDRFDPPTDIIQKSPWRQVRQADPCPFRSRAAIDDEEEAEPSESSW